MSRTRGKNLKRLNNNNTYNKKLLIPSRVKNVTYDCKSTDVVNNLPPSKNTRSTCRVTDKSVYVKTEPVLISFQPHIIKIVSRLMETIKRRQRINDLFDLPDDIQNSINEVEEYLLELKNLHKSVKLQPTIADLPQELLDINVVDLNIDMNVSNLMSLYDVQGTDNF